MKSTLRLFTLILMAMSVFSCSKDSVKEFGEEISQKSVTITAGITGDAKTKTLLGDTSYESTKVYWEEGDSFVLTIDEVDYTFNIDPAYSNENPSTYATFTCADAPETIAAGEYVAKYSNSTTPTQQSGTKEGLSDYQYMEAAIEIDAERNLEDVSIKFYTKVSVVELTLTHDDFKNAAVSSVALRNMGLAVAESNQSASFTGDSDGNIVVYFVVPAGKEFTSTTITAVCGEKTYVASINSALTMAEGKLYQVKKSMTHRNVIDSGTCGDSLEWELTYTDDENSLTLSITGTGNMYVYHLSSSVPWIEYVDRITSIELSNGLTSIGNYAFSGCLALTSINIPDGVTSIGVSAFYGCSALTSINIPDGVTSIGMWAFYGCSALTSINIPDGVTSIGYYAFYKCSALTSIIIPEGVTSIERYTFYGCKALTSINIPKGVTSIGNYAFSFCNALKMVNCKPTTPPTLGNSAFNTSVTGFSIIVPAASIAEYKTQWNTYATYIVSE